MPAAFDLAAITREMKRVQDAAGQIEPLTIRHADFGLRAAYEVARRVSELRCAEGFTPVGRKIGFTNSRIWQSYGVREPIWGYMYDRTVVLLDGEVSSCSLSGFAEPRIEPEIVFRLRSVPEVGADAAVLIGAIEWVAHGFEIVQSHFPGWRFGAADTIADGGLHARLFVGPRQPAERFGAALAASLEAFTLSLSRGDDLVEVGRGSSVLGSPIAALAHLISVLSAQAGSEPLRPGEIVTTGTITDAYPVRPGERWSSRLEGIPLPGLELTFTE